jgi:hypothetical protein
MANFNILVLLLNQTRNIISHMYTGQLLGAALKKKSSAASINASSSKTKIKHAPKMKHGAYNLWQARNDARESKNMEDPRLWLMLKNGAICRILQRLLGYNKRTDGFLLMKIGSRSLWMGIFASQMVTEGGAWSLVTIMELSLAGHAIFPHSTDAEGAELVACRMGLLQAQEIQALNVVLKTDSTRGTAKVKKGEMNRSVHAP